jgi:oxygen-dependent protoporphyrinogen oxidase
VNPVLIAGGGISGLSAAYYLKKAGIPSLILEKRPSLGGVIRTERVEGCVVETGPDSYLSVKPWATDLIRDLGLEGEIIGSNDHLRKTFIRKHGRMLPLPDGLQMMVPTRIAPMITTPLLSWGTKIRMGLEYFRHAPGRVLDDRSVAEFVRDHYGQEAVDYLAEPLLSGVYGGDPEQMSVGSVLTRFVQLESEYGSLTRGTLAERSRKGSGLPLFRTLKGGLSVLTDTLARQVTARTGEVETIERGWRARVSGEWIEAEHLVLACEAHSAANLVATVDSRLAELLNSVGYRSSSIVVLGFDKAAVPDVEGFGFLVPKRERRVVVAGTYVNTKFSHRAPDDTLLVRCFLGSAEEVSVEAVLDELRELAGIAVPPRFSRIYRWPRSMAQYAVGHQARMAEVESRLRDLPGLHLAGNGYYGIGIPDCVREGKKAAERIAAGSRR